MVALIIAIQIFQIFLPKKKMYINLVIYIYTFILLLSSIFIIYSSWEEKYQNIMWNSSFSCRIIISFIIHFGQFLLPSA